MLQLVCIPRGHALPNYFLETATSWTMLERVAGLSFARVAAAVGISLSSEFKYI